MKKYVLFLFTAWLVPWALAAQTTVASGTCGASGGNLTWVFTSDRTLTISGSGAMADYEVRDMEALGMIMRSAMFLTRKSSRRLWCMKA